MQTRQAMARSLKEKQRQEREALILNAAEDVLMEKGYYDSSIDEIAGRVGVAKGTVYLHFPSKEDLVIAIFARDMQAFALGIQAVIVEKQSAREKLSALLEYLYSGLFSKRTRLLYAIFTNAELRRIFMEKRNCLSDIWEQVASQVTALLEEGKANGEFDPEIPTSIMLSTFLGLLSPRSYERVVVGEQMSGEEMVHYLGRIYFGGVAKK